MGFLDHTLVSWILKDLSSWGCGMVGLASEEKRKAKETRKRNRHTAFAMTPSD